MEITGRLPQYARSRQLERFICRLHDDQRGQMYMLAAVLIIPVFLGFLALVVDVGEMVVVRRQLQTAVDAAALAGAQNLPDSPAIARNVATQYVITNTARLAALSSQVSTSAVITSTNQTNPPIDDAITVTAVRAVTLTLAPLFGHAQTQNIAATATAAVGSLGVQCIFPLGVISTTASVKSMIAADVDLTIPAVMTGTQPGTGTFQAWDVGTGAKDLKNAIMADPCPPEQIEQVGTTLLVDPKNGDPAQYMKNSFSVRIPTPPGPQPFSSVVQVGRAEDGTATYTLLQPSSPQLFYVAIMTPPVAKGNQYQFTMLSFVLFFVESWQETNKPDPPSYSIRGHFINVIPPNSLWAPYNGTSTVIRLIR